MSDRRILVADDDPAVRSVTARLLASAGFGVLEAADGPEALAALEAEEVDAVLMDLRMPGMSGRALFETIRHRWPTLTDQIIVTSGDLQQDEWLVTSGVRVLPKPFDREVLLRTLADLPPASRPSSRGDT